MPKTATAEKSETERKTRKPRKNANGHPKPQRAAPAGVDRFGFRIGSKKSQAAAMYATKNGATLAEVKDALKSSQFNLLNELKDRNDPKIKVEAVKVPGLGSRQITRYHIVASK